MRELRYAHAVTDTAPGHSALYTGVVPRASGIGLNEVFTGKDGGKVSILADPATHLVGPKGPMDGTTGSSLAILEVETVADRLRREHPEALILSLSLKDRGALFGGGRKPTATVWLDLQLGEWVTSTAFATSLPSWVKEPSIESERAYVWNPLNEGWVRGHAATPDAAPGEGDAAGLGTTFPHALAHTDPLPRAFRTTPRADELLLSMALAALDHECAPGRVTLLAVSLSANDYIGHTFGPDSWEAWDELERLDASLAVFLSGLDARFGERGYAVVLAADHGTTTMPEAASLAGTRPWCMSASRDRWARACGSVTRIMPPQLLAELRAATSEGLVRGVDDPYVFLSDEAHALPPAERAVVMAKVASVLARHPEIASVVDTQKLPAVCPPDADESIPALVCRSVCKSSGDLYVLTRPGSFFDPDVVAGKGTSHGTPYLYDRAVPLLVRAPGRAKAGLVVDEPVGFGAFARTAASLLGVEPPGPARAARDLSRP